MKPKDKSKSKKQIASLKSDRSLFSRLYVACQIRSGNLEQFFCHENQSFPPSLSACGQINQGSKSDLIGCLEEVNDAVVTSKPKVDAVILDGAAVVHFLKPGASVTFADYSNDVFCPYISSQLQEVSRVDIVWDRYFGDSLKAASRAKRGRGKRRRVEASTKIPKNW